MREQNAVFEIGGSTLHAWKKRRDRQNEDHFSRRFSWQILVVPTAHTEEIKRRQLKHRSRF